MSKSDYVADFSAWSVLANQASRGLDETRSTLFDLAREKAFATPNNVAFFCDPAGAVTYGQIYREACAVAAALRKMGVERGDVIGMQLPNWKEAVAINLAVCALGAIINPIPPIFRGAELKILLKDAGSIVLFVPGCQEKKDRTEMISVVQAALPYPLSVVYVRGTTGLTYQKLIDDEEGGKFTPSSVDPRSIKLLLYTSGTTGKPKGALHTHLSMQVWPKIIMREWGLGLGDIMFMPSPVSHVTGYAFGLELPFISPVCSALMDEWSARNALSYINEVGATACVGATPFLKELIDEAERAGDGIDTLKIFACGGASVAPELMYKVRQVTKRCHAFRVYGTSEAPMVTRGFPHVDDVAIAAETDGKVIGYEVKIADIRSGKVIDMDSGRSGEILVRGDSMMLGYTGATENVEAYDDDHFFLTGDVGYINDGGGLVITGRKKDIIIRGGENLSPKEIEDILISHPDIAEAAVVGMAHPRLGEAVCAFVRVAVGGSAPSVMDLARFLECNDLAREKFPERIEYINDFPRTSSGKVMKDLLRDAVNTSLVVCVR